MGGAETIIGHPTTNICRFVYEDEGIVHVSKHKAELRIAGDLSKDKLLLDNFNAGGDFHSELASCSWQVICQDRNEEYKPINKGNNPKWLDSDFRTIHKQVNFGLLYGCSAKRIAEVLHISIELAKKCETAIKKKVVILMKYLKKQQDTASRTGLLINPYTNRRKHELSATEASNWQIQSTNAEAMKIALYEIYWHIKNNKIDGWIINTVHDSVVVCLNENTDATFIKDIVADSLGLFLKDIKGEADLSIAKYWKK
jgi:DNA polymerase I-like protein with 3'-5' exonuclease and polymerase domains